jgi:hypothetical protein
MVWKKLGRLKKPSDQLFDGLAKPQHWMEKLGLRVDPEKTHLPPILLRFVSTRFGQE